jgi:hypothetical protein
MVGDAITNETGWLVEWFNYDILEEKEIEE